VPNHPQPRVLPLLVVSIAAGCGWFWGLEVVGFEVDADTLAARFVRYGSAPVWGAVAAVAFSWRSRPRVRLWLAGFLVASVGFAGGMLLGLIILLFALLIRGGTGV